VTGSGDKKATLYEVIYERWEWVVWIHTYTDLIKWTIKTFSAYYQFISCLLLLLLLFFFFKIFVCVDLRYIHSLLFAFICAPIQWVCLLSLSSWVRYFKILWPIFVTNYILYIYINACVSIFASFFCFILYIYIFLHMFVLFMCICLLFLFFVIVCLRHLKIERKNLTRIINSARNLSDLTKYKIHKNLIMGFCLNILKRRSISLRKKIFCASLPTATSIEKICCCYFIWYVYLLVSMSHEIPMTANIFIFFYFRQFFE